ncbi:MAG: sensor histidine kinase [Chitinophagaceae bacterium]|nr:sensor histidine kinase [Chitinophagaceae bacterium]
MNIGTNNGVLQYYKQTNNIKSVSSINNIRPGLVHQITANKNVIALNTAAGLAFTDYDFKKNYWLNDKDLKKYFSYAQLSFDKSGNLWITEDGTGQIVFSFKEKLFHKIPDEKGEIPFLKTPVVANIAELPDKNILFHSQWFLNKADNGIYKFNNKEFENNFYRSVTDTLRKGNWFFTESNIRSHGIQFRNADGVFENYTEKQEEIKNSQQQDLVVLENGSVLTSFSNGLYWLNEKEKKLQIANDITAAFKINLLSNNRIAVSYLNKDMLLFKVNNDKSLTQIRNILPSVQSFYIQQNIKTNQYWAGTNRGVYLLDRNFKIQEHFDANNGLAGTNIYGLLLDDEGNAWCSHQRGLSSINATNHVVVNYDKSDGIQDWDFNNRSFYKATDGTLYFGGVNGANYFKPPLQTKAYYKPEIYIDEILVNNNIFSPDTNANQLQKISLDYKNNNISFRAVIRDLENAAYQQIIFRIKERGDVWNYLPNKGSVNLTNLAAGDYTLELGIFEKFTNSHIIQKTIRIQISAPFYFKIWFWALVAIVSTGFLFWIYNRRKLAQQTRAFQQKLALELQRNKITADLHDDIGASLSSLQLNSAVAGQLVNQDAKQAKLVLDKIENQAKNIADKIGDIIWSMKPGEDEFMTISSRIKNFANDILGATNIDYTIHIDKRADVEIKDIDSRKNIVLITKEALNNAVKYSKASKITIDLKIENHKIMLSIADDGIGFISNGTNGNGLVNMKKRAEELKGLFAIKTTEGKGTEIHCEIPL